MSPARKRGFPPVAAPDARILVLGSMPGEESLRQRQYYAHPRNAFWSIMAAVLRFDPAAPYAERTAVLVRNRIALWDVLASCHREGSLDTGIRSATVRVNDFAAFFRAHPAIRRVVFNGGRAEQEFNRRVRPALEPALARLAFARVPSTSPAMATLSRARKRAAWARALQPERQAAG